MNNLNAHNCSGHGCGNMEYSEYGHGIGISYSNSAKSGHCGWIRGDVWRKGAGRLPAKDCDFCLRDVDGCSSDGTNHWWCNHRDEGEGFPKDTDDNQIQLWQILNKGGKL